MSNHKITLRIGAAVDGDLERILFEPAARGAARARKAARSEAMSARDEQLAIKKDQLARERQLLAQAHAHKLAMERDSARETRRVERQATQERERDNQRILAQAERDAREKARVLIQAERMAARAARKAHEENVRGVRSFASSATGTTAGIVRRGVGVAADIARGAGVQLDIGAGVQKRVALEKAAVDLSNSAYQEKGVGIQTQRVDQRALMEEAQKIAQETALSPESAMAGLQKFTAVTGDLATARAALADMAKLAKATGSNLDDVVATSGEISKGMGESATSEKEAVDRAKQLYEIMKGVAGGGKLGSVEMSDAAKHGGRVAAAASQFSGGVSQNLLKMAAFMQEARGGGGAWNAATAAGAVSGLVTTFKTPARQKAFAAAGINIFDKDKKIRDPFALLTEAIDKTAGDPKKLQGMFANVVGARAMQNFANIYLDKSGGKTDAASRKAGRDALQAEMERMTAKATMSDSEVNTSFARAMDTTGSKVELFQQKLDRVVGDMADQVIPALMKLAPVALDATNGLSKMATWAAANPMQAAGAAMVAGLGKAMGDQLATAIGTRMASAFAGNMALTGVTLATLAIASVGVMAIEHLAKKSEEDDKRKFANEAEALNNRAALLAAERQASKEAAAGGVSPETAARLEKARLAVGSRERELTEKLTGTEGKKKAGLFSDITDGFSGAATARAFNSLMSTMLISYRVGNGQTVEGYNKEQKGIGDAEAIKAELAAVKAAMDAVNKTLGGGIAIKSLPAGALSPPGGSSTTGPGG